MNGVTQWEAKEIIREKNARIEQLTAEVERLREALRIIRCDCNQLAFAQWLADNALEGKP